MKRWIIAEPEPALAQTLGDALQLPAAIAQVLLNRGIRDGEAARAFLHPQLRQLGDPFALPGMAPAVDRILSAIEKRERIVIYGDYDVDGVTSSALLQRVLQAAGATVVNFLPHRMEEGYGLSVDGLTRCVKEHQPQLLLAVDCGTTAVAEVASLKSQGVEVIVLDHHEPAERLPECVALVNPKCGDRASTPLASVGVCFKLAHALLKQDRRLSDAIDLREHLDLVAIGTVADIVPLTGENRILVKAGLERLPRTKKAGLRALMEVADMPDVVNPYHIGFRIGPRLNAAGRLDDAMAALELLLTEDAGRATELAKRLNDHNMERQQVESRIVEEALQMAREHAGDCVLVLAKEGWHVGVIGIVASRVLQAFYRPTVIIGLEDGAGKGSCRSISGFSIVKALGKCAPLLEKFGGHEMAAGLSVKETNIAELRRALNAYAVDAIQEEDLRPQVRIDAVIRLGELDAAFFAGLEQLEPCGSEHPQPVFAARAVRWSGARRIVGRNHLRWHVTDGAATVPAIWWGHGDVELPGEFDIAFAAELNEYRGVESVQLKVKDVRPSA